MQQSKEYILSGDIFQVVLSQRFCLPFQGDPFSAYRALRRINPSPYMFHLQLGGMTLCGASPEMLVRVEGEEVQTRPIDISFCLEVPSLLFIRLPTWYGIIRFGSREDVIAALSDTETRAQLVAEAAAMAPVWEGLVLRQVNTPVNQALVGKTLACSSAPRRKLRWS